MPDSEIIRRGQIRFRASKEIVTRQNVAGHAVTVGGVIIPAAIARAGERAARRFLEFFAATIRNRNTREAYYRACCRFLAWCEDKGIADLVDIEPLHVAKSWVRIFQSRP